MIQADNILGGRSDTYRSADGTARNDKLDTLAPFETIDTSFREEGRCLPRTTQNLEQNGNSRRLERNTIDIEFERRSILNIYIRIEAFGQMDSGTYKHNAQINIDVRATRSGFAGLGHRISERAEESLT